MTLPLRQANVMEFDHSAESALSAFYLAGSRREIFNTLKILPRIVQQSLFNCLKKDLGFDFFLSV